MYINVSSMKRAMGRDSRLSIEWRWRNCSVAMTFVTKLIKICEACGFVNGPAAQTVIAIVENGNLALSDRFMRLVKSNVHRIARPPLAYRDGDGGHAMADLHARTEALA